MAKLSYKARRRWALVILLVGLPIYIIVVLNVLALLGRPPIWVEFLVYIAVGVAWIYPFKSIFRGVGQPNPDAEDDQNGSAGS